MAKLAIILYIYFCQKKKEQATIYVEVSKSRSLCDSRFCKIVFFAKHVWTCFCYFFAERCQCTWETKALRSQHSPINCKVSHASISYVRVTPILSRAPPPSLPISHYNGSEIGGGGRIKKFRKKNTKNWAAVEFANLIFYSLLTFLASHCAREREGKKEGKRNWIWKLHFSLFYCCKMKMETFLKSIITRQGKAEIECQVIKQSAYTLLLFYLHLNRRSEEWVYRTFSKHQSRSCPS